MDKQKTVQKIYSRIEEIPTLSPLLQKIMSLIESRRSDAHDVTEVISRDPSLTSRILKVANSAYYGFPQTIANLDRAIMLLGFNMVKTLAMSIGIIRTMPSGNKTNRFSRERLWIHSLAVATVMKELGARCGREEESESLFVTGLLHDIGKIVLDQFFTEQYQEAMEESGAVSSAAFCEAEEKIFGMDHGEVGSILLKRWNFPETTCNPIAVHHKNELPDNTDAMDVSMLHISDILSQETGMGVIENAAPPEIQESDLQTIGMTVKEINNLRNYLIESKDGIYEFFHSMS